MRRRAGREKEGLCGEEGSAGAGRSRSPWEPRGFHVGGVSVACAFPCAVGELRRRASLYRVTPLLSELKM